MNRPLYFLVAALFCLTAWAYQPLVEISLSASKETLQTAEDVFQKSVSQGLLKLRLKKTEKSGPMMQLEISSKTWEETFSNQMMVPGQKQIVPGILLDALRSVGQSYVTAFQDKKLQLEKWQALSERITLHEMEQPTKLKQLLDTDDARFVLFYNGDGKLTNFVASVAVGLARKELPDAEVVIIDCTHDPETCAEYDIQEYPTLRCFKERKFYADFDDSRLQTADSKDIRDWVRGLLQPALHSITEEQVPYFRSGIVPGFGEQVDTVHMLFIENKKGKVYKEFKKLANSFHGVLTFGAVVNPEVEKWAIHPAIITMKPLELDVQAYTHHTDMSFEAMRAYVEAASDPALFDFTSPRQVLRAFSFNLPVLVFFDPKSTSPSSDLHELAGDSDMSYRTTKARLATINGTSPFALSLLTSFGVRQFDRAQWILVNLNEEAGFIRPFKKETLEEIKSFISDPRKITEPRDISFTIESIRNVVFGEMVNDAEILFNNRFSHEPGTLPKPPIHNEEHDEL